MQRKTKIILIIALLLILGTGIFIEETEIIDLDFLYYKNATGIIGENDLGTVEKYVYGNPNATKTIALITGIHPREKLAIDPEIKAAKEFGNETNDTKILHYQVNVTKNAKNYKKGRANGESLVHDYVNPNIIGSNVDAVIISHSHVAG